MNIIYPTTLTVALLTSPLSFGAGGPNIFYGHVQPFVELPQGIRHPEGLAVNPDNGEVYVGTFDTRMPSSTRHNELLRYSADGKLIAERDFGEAPLTGVEFKDGKLYVLNFGSSKLQRLRADFSSSTPIEDVVAFKALTPPAPPPRYIDNPDGSQDIVTFSSKGMPSPNGMVFDKHNNLYISDSFQGAVYRIESVGSCAPCSLTTFARDPLFATAGHVPFGANGLAFNQDESVLYINNAGDGRVLSMPMTGGQVSVLAESVFGADGLLFHDGYLWVASNQSDAMVALDQRGRVRARVGEFLGINENGAPKGLLFPSGGAVQGTRMIVANLALPLTPAIGDEWEEDVTRWNLMSFEIPSLGIHNK
ncbi:MAG: SMP-30/gluconolactonase/LRE family protein [Janthinobacterium lividum]